MVAGLSLEHKRLSDSWVGGELDDKRADVVSLSLDGITTAMAGQTRYRLALTGGDLDIKGPADYIQAQRRDRRHGGALRQGVGPGRVPAAAGQLEFPQRQAVRAGGQPQPRFLREIPARRFQRHPRVSGRRGGGRRGVAGADRLGDSPAPGRACQARPPCAPSSTTARSGSTTGTRGGLADPGIPNHYSLSGAGVGFNWTLPQGWAFSAYVATKLGNNPGRSASGNDADGKDSSARGWVSAEWGF